MCTPISGSSSMRSCSSAPQYRLDAAFIPLQIFAHQSCPRSKCNGSTKFLSCARSYFSSTEGARGPAGLYSRERYRTGHRERGSTNSRDVLIKEGRYNGRIW